MFTLACSSHFSLAPEQTDGPQWRVKPEPHMPQVVQHADTVHSSRSIASLIAQSVEQVSPDGGLPMLDVVLDQMADGIIITDASGRLRRINPAAARMHGRAL